MPYITQQRREELAAGIGEPSTPGELNYTVTRVVHRYLGNQGRNYAAFNAAVGALECAKLELYRRFVVPYEDEKIAENGDVTP